MKYELTGKSLIGSLIFDYNDDGDLAAFYCNAELSFEQKKWLHTWFPVRLELLMDLVAHVKTMKLLEIPETITFEMFYERYEVKRDKVAAQKAWKKLSQVDQVKAFRHSLKYKASLPAWQTPKYPATYLHDKPWLD